MSMYYRVSEAFLQSRRNGDSNRSTLALAYIGDTVYDLYVRSYLISNSDGSAHSLHMCAKKLVCARAQAAAYEKIANILTDEELALYRRGRNSHIGTVPKSCDISEYRSATGMETLIGYMYMNGYDERISQIMSIILDGASYTPKSTPKARIR